MEEAGHEVTNTTRVATHESSIRRHNKITLDMEVHILAVPIGFSAVTGRVAAGKGVHDPSRGFAWFVVEYAVCSSHSPIRSFACPSAARSCISVNDFDA